MVEANVDIRHSSIDTSRIPTASVRPQIVAGVVLDGKGQQVVQLFHPYKPGGFLLLPL
jgi:hypothetical protein